MAALKVKDYNLQLDLNLVEHHTDQYNSTDLIVRRAQPFSITLNFNRAVSKEDKLNFVAVTGPSSSGPDRSINPIFPLSTSGSRDSWSAIHQSSDSRAVNITICSPANAVIGCYKLSVQVSSKQGKTSSFRLGQFILLFNPWAPDDDVYMAEEEERKEYVLNDYGISYFGHEKHIAEEGWNLGQFEEKILNICLALLDRNLMYLEDPALDCSCRKMPLYVSRVVSAMVNGYDDKGVLEGNWDDRFSGGVNPADWHGSVEILWKWHKRGYTLLNTASAWVFAGVTCTILRCLGIPTRNVTNFASAHDKNRNLCIDEYYDSSGKALKKSDGLWNYHVWNESWFKRNDLKSSYSGWQVVDATPQEISDGRYCCGPASVQAIKEGDVDLDYDTAFVFAAVNANRCTWIYYDKKIRERVYCDTKVVGQNISTKAVGSDDRVDITANYKYPEGSAKERRIYIKACKKLQKAGIINKKDTGRVTIGRKKPIKKRPSTTTEASSETPEDPAVPDISGKFQLQESPAFGDDIHLVLILKNLTSESKSVRVKISSSAIMYTGVPIYELLKDSLSATIDPKGEKQIPLEIHNSLYETHLTKDYMIEVSALCNVKQGRKLLVRKVVSLEKPPITITLLGDAVVDEVVEVEVTLTNPLSEWVKDGVLVVEGSGLIEGQLRKQVPSLKPKESTCVTFEIIPHRSGARQLLADFTSRKFSDIKGFQSIEVEEGY
ncbi:LOW QUALITY PROTEIN: protein-glutamine gamma-glutamyltransferase 6-like [Rhinatrema bivittatum]|uniref:LOW QUALITY PROTEIN: protein-glutamine gamma-glutamyltransferase 6-like n=1 Tax=Rhinatrema bivittatum TaxID=194408 RepID=UPI00112E9A45|nr:LOW QUALITY PROTEIN: protein-glutamine gamma-glutamyltransferase 6-like [Rhinatrema bivittatum]